MLTTTLSHHLLLTTCTSSETCVV